MSVRRLFACIAAASLSVLAHGGHAAPGRPLVVVFGPPEARCPAGRLPRATVGELAANPAKFKGRCVRVLGVWARRELYADVDAYQSREADAQRLAGDPARTPRLIGVYAPKDLIDRKGASYDTPVRADMIGRVGSCADLEAGAAMVAGYCHTGPSNAFLAVHDADLAPVRSR